jgi:hypothetical protein
LSSSSSCRVVVVVVVVVVYVAALRDSPVEERTSQDRRVDLEKRARLLILVVSSLLPISASALQAKRQSVGTSRRVTA